MAEESNGFDIWLGVGVTIGVAFLVFWLVFVIASNLPK